MFRFLVVSLFSTGLLVSGCETEKSGLHHRGCHRIGANRAGRVGVIHHHYAKPHISTESKAK